MYSNAILSKVKLGGKVQKPQQFGKYSMTEEKRKFYDQQYVWARLSMSEDEFNEWSYKVSWPTSPSHPDGLFDSLKEYREYFHFDYE